MIRLGLLGAATALLLAGCSAASHQPAASRSPSLTQAAVAKPAGWDFCDAFVPGMSPYADYIYEASQGRVSTTTNSAQADYIGKMRIAAPAGEATLVEDYAGPFAAINTVILSGGGQLSLNTTAYKSSIIPLMAFCNGVGYKLPTP